jgi:sensor histidine kinase YesM
MNIETSTMKAAIFTTKLFKTTEKLNDAGFRVILIPFFGIAIPIITKMIPPGSLSSWQLKLSFIYTIFIAFIIWEGNRFLLFTLRAYFNWLNKPVKKIFALLVAIPFYTIPVSIIMLTGWYKIFLNGAVNRGVVFDTTLLILICVIFIVHVYETVFLVKQTAGDQVKKEQLERLKLQAELEALKNQIDPHFIFNSLNTLSYLIEEQPAKAKQFNDSLADVYRYILLNKGKKLVMLQEEMNFLFDYFSLLKIRFGTALQLNVLIPAYALEKYLVPPISLQVLMENATKHNEFSDTAPMVVSIEMKGETLYVQNKLHLKMLRKTSLKTGLQNLAERYALITGKTLTVEDDGNSFTVSLPLLKIV